MSDTTSDTQTGIDPKSFAVGTVLQHVSGGKSTLANRKADGTGWWCAEGGGLNDAMFDREGEWSVVAVPSQPVEYSPIGWTKHGSSGA